MTNTQPSIDIVIPNFNGLKFLPHCLESIYRQTYQHVTVTVVDNNSSDGSVAFLRANFPDVNLILLSENFGFSSAVNSGIRAGDHSLVFLLNNDTELAADCLERLVKVFSLAEKYAFCAPKMLSFNERDILDGAGDGFLRGGVGYRLGTMEHDGVEYAEQRSVFGACAGAALYRRSLFEAIGYFDEDFFAYLEDVDLNLRANRAGLRCLYVPEAVVYHIGSATTGSKINDFTVKLSTRNTYFVLLKNYPFFLFLRLLPVICIYQLFWLLFVIKKKRFHAYLQGVYGVLGQITKMRKKYHHSLRAQTISTAELAAILKSAEDNVVVSIMHRRMEEGKSNLMLSMYRTIFL